MRSPPGEKAELVGVEKQTMTLVLSMMEGCKVDLADDSEPLNFGGSNKIEVSSSPRNG